MPNRVRLGGTATTRRRRNLRRACHLPWPRSSAADPPADRLHRTVAQVSVHFSWMPDTETCAGAWQIHSLVSLGEDSIAAAGYVGYQPGTGGIGVSVVKIFGDRDVTFACARQTEPLPVPRARARTRDSVASFEYWIWAPRAEVEECLLKPIKMTVNGKTYRLDTSLLRKAVANAVARAAG